MHACRRCKALIERYAEQGRLKHPSQLLREYAQVCARGPGVVLFCCATFARGSTRKLGSHFPLLSPATSSSATQCKLFLSFHFFQLLSTSTSSFDKWAFVSYLSVSSAGCRLPAPSVVALTPVTRHLPLLCASEKHLELGGR